MFDDPTATAIVVLLALGVFVGVLLATYRGAVTKKKLPTLVIIVLVSVFAFILSMLFD